MPYRITQCYLPQANTSRLNPSHTGQYSIYWPRKDGGLSKNPGQGCKEQLARGCYATAYSQQNSNPDLVTVS